MDLFSRLAYQDTYRWYMKEDLIGVKEILGKATWGEDIVVCEESAKLSIISGENVLKIIKNLDRTTKKADKIAFLLDSIPLIEKQLTSVKDNIIKTFQEVRFPVKGINILQEGKPADKVYIIK